MTYPGVAVTVSPISLEAALPASYATGVDFNALGYTLQGSGDLRGFYVTSFSVERDAQGKVIDRNYNYITRVTATYLGKPVAVIDLTQSVSENPAFSFALKATAPGPVTVTFVDTHGGKYEGTADIAFA